MKCTYLASKIGLGIEMKDNSGLNIENGPETQIV